eukprot:1346294-Amorphochlora_amoeboformis.AAC.1
MYELLSGVPPFPDKPTLPEYFRQMQAKELITLLLEKDPKKRYSAAEVKATHVPIIFYFGLQPLATSLPTVGMSTERVNTWNFTHVT